MRRDPVRVRLFFFDVLKNFIKRATKGVRQLERELERRRIFSRFERDDGLTSDTAGIGEFRLRHGRACQPPLTDAVGDDHWR